MSAIPKVETTNSCSLAVSPGNVGSFNARAFERRASSYSNGLVPRRCAKNASGNHPSFVSQLLSTSANGNPRQTKEFHSSTLNLQTTSGSPSVFFPAECFHALLVFACWNFSLLILRRGGKPLFRRVGLHQFAVVLKNHRRAVAGFQRHLGRRLHQRQPVADKRVPQAVPTVTVSGLLRFTALLPPNVGDVPESVKTKDFLRGLKMKKPLIINGFCSCFNWRPYRESNPGYLREREVS